ncbi:Qat anti-phage system QueC-like protein QatC [Rhodanobacter sp. Col0626]|uniref:Qat anti-phage system QueC-like protein QatC n=1 Tax=Rhodanobacter sp. Col0626 TaxID=3415679 RepID=UPI003CF2C210
MQRVVLFDTGKPGRDVHAGADVIRRVKRGCMVVDSLAWDFVAIALSAYAADSSSLRSKSPDGWTREFDLTVAVRHPDVWNNLAEELTRTLAFLSTDRWTIRFIPGGIAPPSPRKPHRPELDDVVLLSGGLDSLVGALDLAAQGKSLLAVSKLVRGDGERQRRYAKRICKGHHVFNDSTKTLRNAESSQRTRSLVFIAFGVLVATSLARYNRDEGATLYLCENGFIAINPPLTGLRLGSLSTRTAHPVFLAGLTRLFEGAGIRVGVENPYRHKTKGEMLTECLDQARLEELATDSTSCGRFQKFNYHHCGRCIPCQVRRASLLAWGDVEDDTGYVYDDLSINDHQHAAFDDVRAVAMATIAVKTDFGAWLGNALGSPDVPDRAALRDMLRRGIGELAALHEALHVQ